MANVSVVVSMKELVEIFVSDCKGFVVLRHRFKTSVPGPPRPMMSSPADKWPDQKDRA
jgi:hypothetical protein